MEKIDTLFLTIEKKWFDMIVSLEKPEEYRELKPYWIRRLIACNAPEEQKGENRHYAVNMRFYADNGHSWEDIIKGYYSEIKQFRRVEFRNGYGKNARRVTFGIEKISIGTGRPEWGAKPDQDYFVIKLAPF
jgi:hypothetical protein